MAGLLRRVGGTLNLMNTLQQAGMAIRRKMSGLFAPDVTEQELIEEYAMHYRLVRNPSFPPPRDCFDQMDSIERLWKRHGLPGETLEAEADAYAFPLRGSAACVRIDWGLVGEFVVGGKRAQDEFLSIDMDCPFICADDESVWLPEDFNGIPPEAESLIQTARDIAREERIGKLSDSEYFTTED